MIGPMRLEGEEATARLAEDIAMVAAPGWTIRLDGDLGAGKTSFARAFISALADSPDLEVPSPTYTIVQRYDEADPAVLHADLYRLADPSEMTELGLDDPDDPAIRLIEWPSQAGEGAFPGALTLSLTMDGETARAASLSGPDPLMDRLRRSFAIREFLTKSTHATTERRRLQGDASTRRYERLVSDPQLIVMDAARQPDGPVVKDGKPYSQLVHLAESVHAVVAAGTALRANGFAAPEILAQDLDAGLLLLEHLGTGSILRDDGGPDPGRYETVSLLLATLHETDWNPVLPVPGDDSHTLHRYDQDVFLTEISLCPDWYLDHRRIDPVSFDRAGFDATWRSLLAPLDDQPATLTLRDFHSPNLIWRPDQQGLARVGIIDHQDALFGPPAYDVASLIQDARVTVSPTLQSRLLSAYAGARGAGFDREAFEAGVALMTVQRNTKILGIFARLNARDGKPAYLAHLPRIEDYVRQSLEHPSLATLRPFYDQILPRAD
ncbi:MAG: tRNA (adenosine(37)-N6)-threonylcarbamoyltransferase complex ATPase subunit type 1 TsaE [Cohaesibacteraceae bacterium]